LAVLTVGDESWFLLADEIARGSVFVSRFYPDQMAQE
jgi:hypothetical protein